MFYKGIVNRFKYKLSSTLIKMIPKQLEGIVGGEIYTIDERLAQKGIESSNADERNSLVYEQKILGSLEFLSGVILYGVVEQLGFPGEIIGIPLIVDSVSRVSFNQGILATLKEGIVGLYQYYKSEYTKTGGKLPGPNYPKKFD